MPMAIGGQREQSPSRISTAIIGFPDRDDRIFPFPFPFPAS